MDYYGIKMTTTNTATRRPSLSPRARRVLARSVTSTCKASDGTIQVEVDGSEAWLDELVAARLVEVVRCTSDMTGQGGADNVHLRATDRGVRSHALASQAGLV